MFAEDTHTIAVGNGCIIRIFIVLEGNIGQESLSIKGLLSANHIKA
jgi:hypothetical protein